MNDDINSSKNIDDIDEEQKFNESLNQEKNLDKNDVQIQKLQEELSQITDKFYRANADFENIKKRLEKEKIMAVSYASESFAKDMLPIIDALEEALKIEVGDNEFAKNMKDGVNQCVQMLLSSFEKYGITQIKSDGKFDPNIHNAISQIEVENKESGDIAQIYQKGYLYKDRVLRPAMVVVVK
ncbi:nucleotide exchange factor GrpE [Campylobacter sp. FMV-PI01]|uniref:Protein GrpE n=1 Tax=Campylobacter portucalensis TaxID=2608384 RepID=A0A6L5WHB8_9BACT|nr:nucleotide exchange factor GrpE [Campylobacter portucalensis]MSN96608.1 nucleotide exchange factor GrpE [Campylobacter portucalensis]